MCRLLRALQESKRTVAKLTKEKHAADLTAAELRGKAEAERDTQRMEMQMAQQQLEAARAQVVRLESDIKDYKARAQVGSIFWGV
jgi:predicted  nucleic acid-binding Zn-ribbon protein